ncbi:hypothetical protein HELRODRAFT_194746 [Helobdella robusta]|uniref:SHSP domain-containing protein n=1 Tax=Helobdella robusta TaxID=6412 RepID=T1FWD2_HELRO|nr:hypothetical protein HELRODRAFT_194746 [Helobdella robusta]ESN89894.1 hypothetical protein HELRODRAFT_194746 [Helobdella robusta]
MRRLKIVKDDHTFDERTSRLLKDVRRQMDSDLMNFGFDRRTNKQLLSSIGAAHDTDDDDDDDVMGKLLGSKSLLSSRRLTDDDDSFFPGRSTTTTSKFGFGNNDRRGNAKPSAATTATTTAAAAASSREGSEPFSVSFNLSGFNAEDISVTCEDGVLSVSARQEVNNNGAKSVKEFSRKVQIPDDVKPEQLESSFTTDGILMVEAPLDSTQQLSSSCSRSQQQAADKSCSFSSFSPSIPLETPVFTAEATGRKKLDLVLELGPPYESEDVVVRLDGRKLIIEATHAVKKSGGTSKTSMNREFDLQEDVDPASLDASLTMGKLYVTGLTSKQGKCKVVTS